jgi:hypothetical protein
MAVDGERHYLFSPPFYLFAPLIFLLAALFLNLRLELVVILYAAFALLAGSEIYLEQP